MTIESRQVPVTAEPARSAVLRRAVAIGLGALCVALAAQVSVPVPLNPVPMTLQPLAVLAVGGLLGASGGLAALVTYLALGMAGLPVFAGGSAGVVHLLGPTGGYLLAFPLAAGLVGVLVGRRFGVLRVLAACALGMVVIHVGGVAQLALLGGDPALAFRIGFVPFLTGDLLKVGLAAAVILGAGPAVRARL
ncbi:MAG TPA: biotin transporter BioY [Gemmatimonadales bacterium]|jgi:biotin transport system substrate-specific component|nr:biotin transporter BioY [Gemmatimonadales bacterium]